MIVNSATADALDYINERAADVYRAYTPGAHSAHGDVSREGVQSRAVFDPLSVAPPDDAYFVTTDDRGRKAYTQNGNFRLLNGTIVGTNGRPVLGTIASNGALVELRVDPIDAAVGRVQNLHVEADGAVSYSRLSIEPKTGARENERVIVGRLALARFPAATKLSQLDGERALAPAGVVPHLGRPGDGNFAALQPMRQSASRIDMDKSLDRLNDAYMAFDALQAAHKAQGSLSKTAMDLLK